MSDDAIYTAARDVLQAFPKIGSMETAANIVRIAMQAQNEGPKIADLKRQLAAERDYGLRLQAQIDSIHAYADSRNTRVQRREER